MMMHGGARSCRHGGQTRCGGIISGGVTLASQWLELPQGSPDGIQLALGLGMALDWADSTKAHSMTLGGSWATAMA